MPLTKEDFDIMENIESVSIHIHARLLADIRKKLIENRDLLFDDITIDWNSNTCVYTIKANFKYKHHDNRFGGYSFSDN